MKSTLITGTNIVKGGRISPGDVCLKNAMSLAIGGALLDNLTRLILKSLFSNSSYWILSGLSGRIGIIFGAI